MRLVGAAYALGSVKASWNWSVSDKLEELMLGSGLPPLLWEPWYPACFAAGSDWLGVKLPM